MNERVEVTAVPGGLKEIDWRTEGRSTASQVRGVNSIERRLEQSSRWASITQLHSVLLIFLVLEARLIGSGRLLAEVTSECP